MRRPASSLVAYRKLVSAERIEICVWCFSGGRLQVRVVFALLKEKAAVSAMEYRICLFVLKD